MRGEPDPNADPYRALGLEPGASTAEIKRAYRLLAKAFHPDSAGEAALPRFLAIHAAYEQLKSGRPVSTPRAARAAPPPSAEPWRADPARARAARERARTARTRSSKAGSAPGRTGTTGGTASTAPSGATGPSGSATPSGSTGPNGSARPSGSGGSTQGTGTSTGRGRGATGTRGAGRRHERKATMGSTSYDEARDPSDATWSGASWYGPSSGEYWIVNPREYADPRKHGPEYQQRARRLAGDEAAEAIGGSDATWASEQSIGGQAGTARGATAAPSSEAAPGSAPSSSGGSGRPGRTATGTREVPRAGPAWARAAEPAVGVGARWDRLGDAAPDGVSVQDPGTQAGRWLGGPADDPIRRLGLALIAWPPIGLAAAAVIGDVTGCSQFAAECTGSEPLLPWLAQAAILGLLLLLPPITRLLAGGAVAVLLALVPITAFLVAIGGTGAPQAGATLAVLLGVAWLLGIGWAAVGLRQRASRAVP